MRGGQVTFPLYIQANLGECHPLLCSEAQPGHSHHPQALVLVSFHVFSYLQISIFHTNWGTLKLNEWISKLVSKLGLWDQNLGHTREKNSHSNEDAVLTVLNYQIPEMWCLPPSSYNVTSIFAFVDRLLMKHMTTNLHLVEVLWMRQWRKLIAPQGKIIECCWIKQRTLFERLSDFSS